VNDFFLTSLIDNDNKRGTLTSLTGYMYQCHRESVIKDYVFTRYIGLKIQDIELWVNNVWATIVEGAFFRTHIT